jgi:hypothetical protein
MSPEVLQLLGALSNIATTVGVVFGILGIVFVWLQVRHAILARDASVCLSLAQFSNTADFTAAIRQVWKVSVGSSPTDDYRDAAMKLCVFFELVGAICNHGYMSTKLVEEFYGTLVVDAYTKLDNFVTAHRNQTGRSSFANNFEALARRLGARQSIRGPNTGK